MNFPHLELGYRDIQKRFNDLDRGKQDHNEINHVYEQYQANKELLQQTLSG